MTDPIPDLSRFLDDQVQTTPVHVLHADVDLAVTANLMH